MTTSRKSQCLDAIRHQILSLALPPGSDLDEAKLGALPKRFGNGQGHIAWHAGRGPGQWA